MPRSRSHQIMRTRYSSVRPRIKERWIIAKQSKDFTDVLRLDPDRADAFFARGVAYYSAADFERAADDFSRAIKLGLVDGVVFYLRSLANSELGDGVRLDPDLQQ